MIDIHAQGHHVFITVDNPIRQQRRVVLTWPEAIELQDKLRKLLCDEVESCPKKALGL